jgi:chromosomal replication initiator protein
VDNSLLWKSVLAEIELSVSSNIFSGFIKKSELVKIENGVVEISSPTNVIKAYLESRYFMLIKSLIEKRTNSPVSLIFSIKKKEETKPVQKGSLFEETATEIKNTLSPSLVSSFSPITNNLKPIASSVSIYSRRAGLRDDFNFDTFAVSGTNEMAHAAAAAVADDPGAAYNPFFLYGGVGVGKTHLMQAIGRKILEKNHDAEIKYLTGEEFTTGIIDAIRNKSTNEFKKKYRGLNALLLDDVQFIAGKEQVQEEFFHTFNAIQKEGGQIVLTSDKPPEEIDKIDERLRSRFQAGLIVDIGQPNFELRCAIIKIKTEKIGIHLPMETVQFLGEIVKGAREIEGLVLKIKSQLFKNPDLDLSISSLKEILKIREEEDFVKKAIDQATILSSVCDFFEVKQTAIKGEKRQKQIVVPRQILMYLLKTEAKMTFSEIGNFLGGRDHTTVMHGVEKMEKLTESDTSVQKQMIKIKQKFTQK